MNEKCYDQGQGPKGERSVSDYVIISLSRFRDTWGVEHLIKVKFSSDTPPFTRIFMLFSAVQHQLMPTDFVKKNIRSFH